MKKRTARLGVVSLAGLLPLIFGAPVAATASPNCTLTEVNAAGETSTANCGNDGNATIDATPRQPEDFADPWGYDDFVGAPFVFGNPFVGGYGTDGYDRPGYSDPGEFHGGAAAGGDHGGR